MTVIIQYYLAFNSDWLFACYRYFVIIFSLVATAVCYSSILVTHRFIPMKVKVCYTCVSVTSKFRTSESTKTRLFK